MKALLNSPQVMSLLPLDPLLPGLCPGTPRYASASSKAGFAPLPAGEGRALPQTPSPLTDTFAQLLLQPTT